MLIPHTSSLAFLLFWNFLVKILQSFWISICLPINISWQQQSKICTSSVVKLYIFCLNSPKIICILGTAKMNIFLWFCSVQFIFTWEFLGALHLKLLTGFVNTYHINRFCGWQLYKVSMGNNGVVAFRPLSSGHIN